jgi:hypothetical protein
MADDSIIVAELDHSPIPDGCARQLDEQTIKRDGEVWRVPKNDPDPFPSDPHAHNVESGLKMHLGTGRLYFGTDDTGKHVSKKDLLAIRNQLSDIELPPLEV